MVPSPPDVTMLSGRENLKYRAESIWFCPTSVTRMASLLVASDTLRATSPMFIIPSEGSVSGLITFSYSTASGRLNVESHSLCPFLRSIGMSLPSTVFASPSTGTVARMFLLNSDGSMSICTIFACGAYFDVSPVTRSSNRMPMAISTSHLLVLTFGPMFPCMPAMPL